MPRAARPDLTLLGALLLAAAILLVGGPAASADSHPEVVEFWLLDADTDARIQPLDDYDSLRLPLLPPNLSIEAVTTGSVDSVVMRIDGTVSSTENFAPWTLAGDPSGDVIAAPALRAPGWITVSAQPFAGPDGTGTAGPEVDLRLYLHQPDYVVRSGADLHDWNPGDGICSTGPTFFIDSFAAVASAKELTDTERRFRDGAPTDGAEIETKLDLQTDRLTLDEAKANADRFALDEAATDADRFALDAKIDPRAAIDPDLLIPIAPRPVLDLDDLLFPWFPVSTCTLRAAIEEANASPGRQSIVVDSTKGPFELTLGELVVTDGVDVLGHGPRALIDAGRRSRVFRIEGDHLVNLRNLDMANGQAPPAGRGGILRITDDAHVQVSDSIIRGGQGNFGGGLYLYEASAVLTNTAVRDNVAGHPDSFGGGGVTQRGGGIASHLSNVTVRHSSISENRAVRGGGISNFGGTIRVENSSVIDNEARSIGGGIENFHSDEHKGNLHLSFATVAHNRSGTSGLPPADRRGGGGLYNRGWAYMASSILASNTDYWSAGDPHHAPDCYSPNTYDFKSFRHNVVGVLNGNCDLGDYSSGSTAWIDHGTEGAPLNAHLGGITSWDHIRYRMIGVSSPAVDGGASQTASLYPCPASDSRGRARPVGGGCDIGAVERQ